MFPLIRERGSDFGRRRKAAFCSELGGGETDGDKDRQEWRKTGNPTGVGHKSDWKISSSSVVAAAAATTTRMTGAKSRCPALPGSPRRSNRRGPCGARCSWRAMMAAEPQHHVVSRPTSGLSMTHSLGLGRRRRRRRPRGFPRLPGSGFLFRVFISCVLLASLACQAVSRGKRKFPRQERGNWRRHSPNLNASYTYVKDASKIPNILTTQNNLPIRAYAIPCIPKKLGGIIPYAA